MLPGLLTFIHTGMNVTSLAGSRIWHSALALSAREAPDAVGCK